MKPGVKIALALIVVGGGAVGIWYYMQYLKKQADAQAAATQAASDAAAQAAADLKHSFCNPPISGIGVDAAQQGLAWQKNIAMQQWNAQGRGSDPDYFFTQFKQQMGC